MVKKILIVSAALVALGFVFIPGLPNHVGNLWDRAKGSVQEALPIDYELERAERMIGDILPEIEACKRVVAEEQVEIRYLEQEIARLERHREQEARSLQTQNAALKTGQATFQIAGRSYSRESLEHSVRLGFKNHKGNGALLESKRRLLDARAASLAAAQQRLDTVCSEKVDLETKVEELRARLRAAQAVEATTGRFELDASNLARAKEIIARCGKRLDIAQQLIENEAGTVVTLPAPEEIETVDITAEVDRYFAAGGEPAPRDADN